MTTTGRGLRPQAPRLYEAVAAKASSRVARCPRSPVRVVRLESWSGTFELMETARTTHTARAQSGNIAGLYQARCTCGWYGPVQGSETSADNTAQAHTSIAHGAEPLDEQRRRLV